MLIEMNRFVGIIEAGRAHEARSFGTALPRRQTPGERHLSCPACRQRMVGHLYGGPGNVVIDTCEQCLLNWLTWRAPSNRGCAGPAAFTVGTE